MPSKAAPRRAGAAGELELNALPVDWFLVLPNGSFARDRAALAGASPIGHARTLARGIYTGSLAYVAALARGGLRFAEVSLAEDTHFADHALRPPRLREGRAAQ